MILILTKLQSQVPVSSDSDTDTGSDQVTNSGTQWSTSWQHRDWKHKRKGLRLRVLFTVINLFLRYLGLKRHVYGISRWLMIRSSFIKRPLFVLVILQTAFLELLPISYPTIENKWILLSFAVGGWVVIVIVRLVLSSWSQGQLSSAVGSQVVKGSWSLQLTD